MGGSGDSAIIASVRLCPEYCIYRYYYSVRQYSGCPSIYGLGLNTDIKLNKISCIMKNDSNLLTEMKYSRYID